MNKTNEGRMLKIEMLYDKDKYNIDLDIRCTDILKGLIEITDSKHELNKALIKIDDALHEYFEFVEEKLEKVDIKEVDKIISKLEK